MSFYLSARSCVCRELDIHPISRVGLHYQGLAHSAESSRECDLVVSAGVGTCIYLILMH